MKRLIFTAVFIIALSAVYAHDWYGYMNKTHTEIMKEFGTPDLIDVYELNSFRVKEDSRDCKTDNDISFIYNKTGVIFFFDNQGSAKPYWDSEDMNTLYSDIFGQNGILRVSGMYFFNTDEELPYGMKLGTGLTDVLTNKTLGTPLAYTPGEVDFSLIVKDDKEERKILKGEASRLDNEVNEYVCVYMKDSTVTGVLVRRLHTVSISFK